MLLKENEIGASKLRIFSDTTSVSTQMIEIS